MSVVLADDEQRRLDDESEVAMLERTSVLFSHEEADQAPVLLAHLVGRLIERDARTVHDSKIGGEDTVERNEAVIQDRSRVLR